MKLYEISLLLLIIGAVSCKKAHHKKEKKHTQEEKKLQEELLLHDTERGGYVDDPCHKHKCGPGKQCEIDEEGKARCECVSKCHEEHDTRRRVCSNHNETWDSDCELYRMRCLCAQDLEGCKLNKYKHVHVDYYGPCKEMGECSPTELSDFPRRMREWLLNVMQELARRDQLRGGALRMEEEAEKKRRGWVDAVIWKFCDLDVHPHDRHVSRHELFPLRAPLLSMERCVAPFLDSCDADADHRITLPEWGSCLGLEQDEIQDKCETLHKG